MIENIGWAWNLSPVKQRKGSMDNNLHDEIAQLAYELYEKSGRMEGRDFENWSKAERIVRSRYTVGRNNEAIASDNRKYNGHENRKHKRVAVKGVRRYMSASLNTKIINITAEGAAVETTKRLIINKEYGVKINHGGYALRVKGRIVWSLLTNIERKQSGDIIAVYKAGMKFQHPLFKVSIP
jgi:hypothetical protein